MSDEDFSQDPVVQFVRAHQHHHAGLLHLPPDDEDPRIRAYEDYLASDDPRRPEKD